MASSSSSSTNIVYVTPPNTIVPLTNVTHLITLKLTRENYLLWRAQLLTSKVSNSMALLMALIHLH